MDQKDFRLYWTTKSRCTYTQEPCEDGSFGQKPKKGMRGPMLVLGVSDQKESQEGTIQRTWSPSEERCQHSETLKYLIFRRKEGTTSQRSSAINTLHNLL